MAKRKIIYSKRAQIKLFQILEYFRERNGNSTYSKKLYQKISKEINLLSKHPELGKHTELQNIRSLVIKEYVIFYEVKPESIIIYTIWDNRQNPEELLIK